MNNKYDIIPPHQDSIVEYLRSRGLIVDSLPLASLTRVPTAAHPDSLNGAFLVWRNCGATGDYYLGWAQAHDSDGEPFWFITKPREEWASADREWIAEQQKELSRLTREMRQNALKELTAFYVELREAGDKHPYLEAKRVRPHPALRIYRRRVGDDPRSFPWLDNCLVVPYFNARGELMTLQRIPWEESRWNEKLLYPGAVKKGASLRIEPNRNSGKFIGVAEGFATADSFSRAMDMPVYASIDGGNMAHVAREIIKSGSVGSAGVVIVADNDCETPNNPGMNYALKVAEAANSNSIFVPVLGKLAVDANDLYVRGGEDLVRSQAMFLKTQREVRAILKVNDEPEAGSLPRGFALSSLAGEPGLYYRVHKRSGTDEVKIGDPLEVIAKYREKETGESGKVVCYVPEIVLDEERRMMAYVPDVSLAGSKCVDTLKLLPSYATVKEYHSKIVEYINNAAPAKKIVLMRRTGWSGKDRNTFLFPGDLFEKNGVEYMFPKEDTYSFMSRQGTFEEWKEKVAALAAGNSRAVLALSEAFAAPVRSYLDDDDDVCGWHIVGPNGCGKSTCAKVGASTYGRGSTMNPDGEGALVSWYKTENQMESAAVAHNHMCLYLDEMKLAAKRDPRALEIISYMLTMGNGKGRMAANGKDRKLNTWRIGFFSTGEESLVSYIERGGGMVNSGQEVRICDILHSPGYESNIFENIHGRSSSKVFADELKDNTKKYYGHAFPAFVASLIEHGIDKEDRESFLGVQGRAFFGVFEDSSQELQRVASTMCYNHLAIHLAIKWGILPWDEMIECGMLAQCFDAWRASFTDESGLRSEEQKIRDQWTTFIQENRGKFADPDMRNIGPHVNYGIYDSSEDMFYIWPGTFRRHCGDKKQILYHLRVLRKIGMLPVTQYSRDKTFTTVKKVEKTSFSVYGIKLLNEDTAADSATVTGSAKVTKLDFTKGYTREPYDAGERDLEGMDDVPF